jgi:hypothetical protein
MQYFLKTHTVDASRSSMPTRNNGAPRRPPFPSIVFPGAEGVLVSPRCRVKSVSRYVAHLCFEDGWRWPCSYGRRFGLYVVTYRTLRGGGLQLLWLANQPVSVGAEWPVRSVLFFWHTLFVLRPRFCDRGPNCSPRSRARRVPEAWSSARPYLRAADPPQSCRRLVRRRRHPRRVDRGAARGLRTLALTLRSPRRAQAIACARVLSGATSV